MPDFASQAYWDTRFTRDGNPFDWLVPAQALSQMTTDMIDPEFVKKANVLHIGCGTSDASVLRNLVENASQIHNVDYSEPAVDAGAKREKELLAKVEDLLATDADSKHDSVQEVVAPKPSMMKWSCMDLLSLHSTLGLLQHQNSVGKLYDIVLDKSTSDSISCGKDCTLSLPYQLSINGWTRRIARSGTSQTGNVHPLHVLAVHLAALTTPGKGRWIAVSYSEDRFPFLPPFPVTSESGMLGDDVIKAGFPHPHQLWKLERKEEIHLGDEREESLAERKRRLAQGLVHRPRISHWLYVLRRTDAVVTD